MNFLKLILVSIFTISNCNLSVQTLEGPCKDSVNFCPLVLDDIEPGYDFIRISVPAMELKLQSQSNLSLTSEWGGCTPWDCQYKIDGGPYYSDYLKYLKSPQTLLLLGTRIRPSINFTLVNCRNSKKKKIQSVNFQLVAGTALAGNEIMNSTDKTILLQETYKLLRTLILEEFEMRHATLSTHVESPHPDPHPEPESTSTSKGTTIFNYLNYFILYSTIVFLLYEF